MPEGQSSPTGPDETTAARLLATAAALFRSQGYAGTSIRELAALLGIRNASLYYYMGKKEDLLYAICVDSLRRIHEGATRAISGDLTPLERVKALIRAHLTTTLEDADKHATMLVELRALSPERRAEVLRLRDSYEALVAEVISHAQAAGALRSDVGPKYLTLALFNLLNRTIFWFKPQGELTPGDLADLLGTLFLDGAAARPSG